MKIWGNNILYAEKLYQLCTNCQKAWNIDEKVNIKYKNYGPIRYLGLSRSDPVIAPSTRKRKRNGNARDFPLFWQTQRENDSEQSRRLFILEVELFLVEI